MNLWYNGYVQERSGFLFCQQTTAIMCKLAFPGQIGKSHDGGFLQGAKVKEIKLTPLKYGRVVIVSDDWFEYLNQWKWGCQKNKKRHTGYAYRRKGPRGHAKKIWMHRIIAGTPDDMDCDHIDGDGLHNWPENLRNCTISQNTINRPPLCTNTTGFKGVVYDKKNNKWLAQIIVRGKYNFLGYFNDPESAARAYDAFALKNFGEFAWLNFPEDHKQFL